MEYARGPATDWPAAAISLNDTLRRLGQRLASAEADLRTARATYEVLLESSRTCMGDGPLGSQTARLTAQELRVANLVAAGMSNREVADALHVSIHTVKTHVKNVLEKLSIRSRWQMAATVGSLGLAGTSPREIRSSAIHIRPASDGAGGGATPPRTYRARA
jgi:DNA-binding CsgD family transcriptional regulator